MSYVDSFFWNPLCQHICQYFLRKKDIKRETHYDASLLVVLLTCCLISLEHFSMSLLRIPRTMALCRF